MKRTITTRLFIIFITGCTLVLADSSLSAQKLFTPDDITGTWQVDSMYIDMDIDSSGVTWFKESGVIPIPDAQLVFTGDGKYSGFPIVPELFFFSEGCDAGDTSCGPPVDSGTWSLQDTLVVLNSDIYGDNLNYILAGNDTALSLWTESVIDTMLADTSGTEFVHLTGTLTAQYYLSKPGAAQSIAERFLTANMQNRTLPLRSYNLLGGRAAGNAKGIILMQDESGSLVKRLRLK